jgi:hypothetical protein
MCAKSRTRLALLVRATSMATALWYVILLFPSVRDALFASIVAAVAVVLYTVINGNDAAQKSCTVAATASIGCSASLLSATAHREARARQRSECCTMQRSALMQALCKFRLSSSSLRLCSSQRDAIVAAAAFRLSECSAQIAHCSILNCSRTRLFILF